MNPLISIIIPLYNADQYIEKCIDSVLKQTVDDFEVILVNDGSTDRSKDICNFVASKDNRIRVINKSNGGVSSARNKGLQASVGEWICFLDIDDYIDENYLESFKIQKAIEIDLYAQGYYLDFIDSSLTKLPKAFGIFDIGSGYDILESSNIINSPVFKLYKKGIIEDNNIKFDERISYGEDHIFSMHYLQYVKKIAIRPKAGYHYCVNEGSLTKRQLNLSKMLLYIQLFGESYFFLSEKKNLSFHKAYNLRQYSNIKRLILESKDQFVDFFRLGKQLRQIRPYIMVDGLNFKQKILIYSFLISSKLLSVWK